MSVNAELYRGGHYGDGFDGSERFLTVQQIMHGTGMLGTFPFIHMGLPQVILPRSTPPRYSRRPSATGPPRPSWCQGW